MYKRATKQCSNDVKKRFNYIAKGREKLIGKLSNGQKKWVNGSLILFLMRNKGMGRRRRVI